MASRSGNWGCGAFNGDKRVKAIIQLLACSAGIACIRIRSPLLVSLESNPLCSSLAFYFHPFNLFHWQLNLSSFYYFLSLSSINSLNFISLCLSFFIPFDCFKHVILRFNDHSSISFSPQPNEMCITLPLKMLRSTMILAHFIVL